MLRIISWNVSGLRAVLKKGFQDFVKKDNPNIICLQETKVDSKFNFNLPGYQTFWNNGTKSGYSGTAIFSKIKPLKVSYGINNKEHDNEGRVITLEFEKFFLVNVYVPNSKRGLTRLDYRMKWDQEFLNYLKKLHKPIILCGDMNVAHKEIDIANPNANKNNAGFTEQERNNFTNLLDSGFIDTLRIFNNHPGQYTYWTYFANARERNIGWRLDYVIVSESLKKHVKDSFILSKIKGSDHCPIGASLLI